MSFSARFHRAPADHTQPTRTISLELSVYRAISLIAGSTSVPISTGTGFYGWSFWIPAMFCALSVVITISYIWFDANVVPKEIRLTSNKSAAAAAHDHVARRKFSLGAYWELGCTFEPFVSYQGSSLIISSYRGILDAAGDHDSAVGFHQRLRLHLARPHRLPRIHCEFSGSAAMLLTVELTLICPFRSSSLPLASYRKLSPDSSLKLGAYSLSSSSPLSDSPSTAGDTDSTSSPSPLFFGFSPTPFSASARSTLSCPSSSSHLLGAFRPSL